MQRRHLLKLAGSAVFAVMPRPVLAAAPAKVIVIGAGIMGASIAYHLAKRGADVTVLDKEGPAAGTTRNSFAWLNAASKSPRSYYELNLAGMLGWRRLAGEIGPDLPLQMSGGVSWEPASAEQIAQRRKRLAERQGWGYPVYQVGASDIARLVPGCVPGEVGYGQFCDIEGTIDPVAATTVLVERARAYGATLVYPCEITGLDLGNGIVRGVTTSRGKFAADTVVIAAGNGSPAIAAMAGFDVPLVESRGILAHTKPRPLSLHRVIMTPKGDGKQHLDGRIVTGRDFGDTGDLKPELELGRKYLDNLAEYFPAAASAEIDFMTLGHRVLPKDGRPIIDRAPGYANLMVAAQHSGMTCAPIVGQLLAMEILDQVSVDMLAPYRLSRFA